MPRASTGSKKNGFKAALAISPELSQFLGRDKVSRPQLTKLMWAYFKSQKLMDPTDKRFVLADDKLKALTGTDRFQAFSFMKLLNRHIIKSGGEAKEEVEEEEAVAEEAGAQEGAGEASKAEEEPKAMEEEAPAAEAPAAEAPAAEEAAAPEPAAPKEEEVAEAPVPPQEEEEAKPVVEEAAAAPAPTAEAAAA